MFRLIVDGKNGHEESEYPTEQECIDHHKNNLSHWGEHTYSIVPFGKTLEDISPRQLRLVLLSMGKTEQDIDSTINQLSSPSKEQAMIAWKYSTSFVRSQPAVAMIGQMLGLTSDQLDVIWQTGVQL